MPTMIAAAFKALSDLFSPEFRDILWKSLGLTGLLFLAILLILEILLSVFAAFPWPWLATVAAVATGLGVFAAFVFLLAPVTALFAGLFLDRIAALVERRHYRDDPPGQEMDSVPALLVSIQFGLIVLLVNLAVLPAFFFGIGAIALVVANAYLLSREYFFLAAARHMPRQRANELRRNNNARIFVAGFIPAGMALFPVVNFLVPVFSTVYFVHIYKQIESQPDTPVNTSSGHTGTGPR